MLSAFQLIKKLETKPLFTLNQLSLITNYKKSYLKVLVNRLVKKKILFKIERGKYTVYSDPLIFSSHIVQPSYLTLWTALRFYDLTTQLPREIFVAYKRRKKTINFQKTKINFVCLAPWGFGKKNYQGLEIFVAEKEKLFLDILAAGITPWSEIDELMEKIDDKKLIEYALKTKNKSLIKRAGFILEEYGCRADKLGKFVDNNYVYLVKKGRKRGKKNKKWKIIDNRIK